MNESKHEIPAPMLDAAAEAMMALQGTDGCIATQDLAEAALEAARVAEMAAERGRIGMALFQNGYDSGWTTDSAVEAIEAMAARIAELEGELAEFQTSKFHPDWPVLQTTQENLREAWERIKELEAALGRIAKWFGEFPPTGRTWNDNGQGEEISYFACYGSNGERDYMRQVAASALKGAGGE